MRHYVEQQLGGMAFFLQGAPGDINPYYDKTTLIEDAVALMKQTGQKLGTEAVRVAKSIRTETPENPQIQTKTVVLEAAIAGIWRNFVPFCKSVITWRKYAPVGY